MRNGWTTALCATMVLAFLTPACGGGTEEPKKVEDYIPADGVVSGWVEDTAAAGNLAGVQTAYTVAEGEAYIDGGLDAFVDAGWVAMAWEFYVNGDMKLELRLYEMTDATTCASVYDFLETHPDGTPWEAASLGEGGRIADQGPYWQIHSHKDKYFLESHTWPGDETGKQPALDFATAVLGAIP